MSHDIPPDTEAPPDEPVDPPVEPPVGDPAPDSPTVSAGNTPVDEDEGEH